MFHNPTAAVNLCQVGKQYLTFCKAQAAVTQNLIGRKIISYVKHSDARNSLPILDVVRSSHKRHSTSEYCKWTLRQTTGVCCTRIYVLRASSHFPTEYRHKAAVVSREHRMQWVVILGDCYQWPLPWECRENSSFAYFTAAIAILDNLAILFHQVSITAGWTEVEWYDRFAQHLYTWLAAWLKHRSPIQVLIGLSVA